MLQSPASWPAFASALAEAMGLQNSTSSNFTTSPSLPNANYLSLAALAIPDFPAPNPPADRYGFVPTGQGPLGRLAIAALDGSAKNYNHHDPAKRAKANAKIVDRLLEILERTSPTFGATVHMDEQHGSPYWPGRVGNVEWFSVSEFSGFLSYGSLILSVKGPFNVRSRYLRRRIP